VLIHMSMDALDPERVATVLAEILGGTVVPPPSPPFDPRYRWVCCWDDRGTLLEIGPATIGLRPGPSAEIVFNDQLSSDYSTVHALMASAIPLERVAELAAGEGWQHGMVRNANAFSVLNVWLENRRLIEFATAELIEDYLSVFGPTNKDHLDTSIRALEQSRLATESRSTSS
jgi:hypothetical protein